MVLPTQKALFGIRGLEHWLPYRTKITDFSGHLCVGALQRGKRHTHPQNRPFIFVDRLFGRGGRVICSYWVCSAYFNPLLTHPLMFADNLIGEAGWHPKSVPRIAPPPNKPVHESTIWLPHTPEGVDTFLNADPFAKLPKSRRPNRRRTLDRPRKNLAPYLGRPGQT